MKRISVFILFIIALSMCDNYENEVPHNGPLSELGINDKVSFVKSSNNTITQVLIGRWDFISEDYPVRVRTLMNNKLRYDNSMRATVSWDVTPKDTVLLFTGPFDGYALPAKITINYKEYTKSQYILILGQNEIVL